MESEKQKVVTRFAPSPTGFLHLGAYRTAIFSYLFARKNNGTFVLRIEDTDKERSKKEFEIDILESLKWLDLKYDVFYRQSENAPRHKEVLLKMIDDGFAYVSEELAKDGSGVMKSLVRFKNPNTVVSFHDEIKGMISMDTTDLGDFVIAKNTDEPLFHLAVVVDDFDEGVTHIIRGEDHVSNTPRQILIQKAISAPTPVYAHLPLVLGQDKLKLSKRRGALAISGYRELGFLPEAILNGVTFIGWNPGTDQEIFSHNELIDSFSLDRVQKSPAVFNQEKLEWFNKEHLKKLSSEIIFENIKKEIIKFFPEAEDFLIKKIQPIIVDRISKWSDIRTMIGAGELSYFFAEPEYQKESLIWKNLKDSPDAFIKTTQYLESIVNILENLSENDFEMTKVKDVIWPLTEKEGKGEVLWPTRFALSGVDKSPDPFVLISILGKDKSIARLKNAILKLK